MIAVYHALPDAVRRDFTSPQPAQESGIAAAKALMDAKVDITGPRPRLIGMLFAALAYDEYLPAQFAAA